MFGQYFAGDLSTVPAGSMSNHKKSRFGCKRCRTRRVKCDEKRPACQSCLRHSLPCVYDRQRGPHQAASKEDTHGETCSADTTTAASSSQMGLAGPADSLQDPPETAQRRKLEMVLMHHWRETVAPSVSVDETSVSMFQGEASRLALTFDALLYIIHAISALHLHVVGFGELVDVVAGLGFTTDDIHRRYFLMSLREQLNMIPGINAITMDAITLTSMIVRIYLFTSLQERIIQPYEPPREWMRTNRSTMSIYEQSVRFSRTCVTSHLLRNDSAIRKQLNANNGAAEKLSPIFEHLLDDIEAEAEEWNNSAQSEQVAAASLRDVYTNALQYLDETLRMHDGREEPPTLILRRLTLFPVFIDVGFVDLLYEGRPRVLAILAHYFALLSFYSHIWWIGKSAVREVRAIALELREKPWGAKMEWPLRIVGNDPAGGSTY